MSAVCNQPPRSTQPGHPFVGRCNVYQPKGSDALRIAVGEYRQVWFVCEWQVKLCDPIIKHGPYLSALETKHYTNLCSFTLLYSIV